MTTTPEDLHQQLKRHDQEHVFAFWHQLHDAGRQELLAQVRSLDLEQLRQLYTGRDRSYPVPAPEQIQPVPVVPADSPDRTAARLRGEQALRNGEVAVLLV